MKFSKLGLQHVKLVISSANKGDTFSKEMFKMKSEARENKIINDNISYGNVNNT